MGNEGILVEILMGSASDLEVMKHAKLVLGEFGVKSRISILSAHRTPEQVHELAGSAKQRGVKVIIAGAGMAAHLAGVIASQTTLPVIGIPLAGGAMGGMDSLLSTVQMPKGIPVATVAIGKSGAINAAILAAQMLALAGDIDFEAIEEYRKEQAQKVLKDNESADVLS